MTRLFIFGGEGGAAESLRGHKTLGVTKTVKHVCHPERKRRISFVVVLNADARRRDSSRT